MTKGLLAVVKSFVPAVGWETVSSSEVPRFGTPSSVSCPLVCAPRVDRSIPCFSLPAQNADAQAVLKVARDRLQGKFNFHTMTIQIESYSEDMKNCQECQGPSE